MIECRALSFCFGATEVLHRLDFGLPKGCLAVLLGPNGSGKSTTLRLLSGLLRPPPGTITIDGVDGTTAGPETSAKLGVVPDRLALLDHLCIEEHAEAFGPLYGMTRDEIQGRMEDLIRLLDLGRSRYTPMGSCSHGTRKKAALLLALLHAPKLLLLDEPFEGLDPAAIQVVSQLLVRMSKGGRTVLFTSHALSTAEALATHVLILEGGRLLWGAPAAQLPAPLEKFYFERIASPATPELPWLASAP